ncbi:ribonuclease H-like domain-containing protein [Tanacetum coccineum]
MGLLTIDDGIVNWREHTEDEETNHALMAISSSSEVSLQMKYMKKMKSLKKYRRIGMKAVKEKEQLQKIVDSWKDSSKNLWRLINSGMSSSSKIGLGYEIKSNDEVLSYEEEMNFSVFKCSKEDSIGKPSYSRFTKTNDFKGVPHPLNGDYTPKPQEEIDDSLYVYGKKGPQKPEISVSDDNSSEHSTCQSNDSEGSCGNTSEHSFETESESLSEPNEMKNWNDMMERELGEGYSFTKKKCFVCGSLSHLIKDCDYYEKKMAREAEVKRVVNTGNGVAKPVWTNANRINHSNKFVPRSVQLNAGRPKFNSVRPNINTGRTNINSVRPKVNAVSSNVNTVRSRQPVPNKTSNSFSPKRPQMNQINQRRDFSKSHSSVRRPFAKTTAQMSHSNVVMGSWGSVVKTSASYNWRNSRPNFHYNSGPNFIRTEHPLKNMVDRGIFDSGCSGHMTGNKDQLEDFEEFNGGSVTFGGSKGYISGKGKIRVGNLDFDSVSFVKELGHFNLFSISQICDKQHKVLFTETECLVVSSDFKMPDENQILLKVPRHHNMYSFDMKTPTPAKGFACLIAKATSDESKLWHRRLGHINFKNLNKLVKGNLVRGINRKKLLEALQDTVGVTSMQEELLAFQATNKYRFCMIYLMISNSSMGELTFYLGLQAQGRTSVDGISSLMDNYVTPKTSHLNAVQERIFKYLRENQRLGLWAISNGASRECAKYLCESNKIQVGFLRKPNESAGFAEIVDFLRVSKLRYALTTNPTIYDSLLKQFWQTATANTNADGTLEIKATIDTIRYSISEASIRDSLQLDDATGITMLPNAESFLRE